MCCHIVEIIFIKFRYIGEDYDTSIELIHQM